MASAETTNRPYDALAGNWHLQCALADYQASTGPALSDDYLAHATACFRRKLADKRAANATEWP